MALTRNGKAIGRASYNESQSMRFYLNEIRDRQEEQAKADLDLAMAFLKTYDPQGWEAWYDANVPDFDWLDRPTIDRILNMINAHIEDVTRVAVASLTPGMEGA